MFPDKKTKSAEEVGKVNGRYTEDFKRLVRDAVRKDMSLLDAADYCGVDDTLGTGFRQLFYKIRREEKNGVDLKVINSKHSGTDYTNKKDAGIKDSGAVFSEEDLPRTFTPVKPPDVEQQMKKAVSGVEVKKTEVKLPVSEDKKELVADVKSSSSVIASLMSDYSKVISDLTLTIHYKELELTMLKEQLSSYNKMLKEMAGGLNE